MVCLQSFVDARIHIENINSQRSKWNGMEASENLSDISRFDRGSRYIRAIIKHKKRRLERKNEENPTIRIFTRLISHGGKIIGTESWP